MLNRVSGAAFGIKDYLESGQKQGRDNSRDELDERVILDGDLELTNTIINGMDKAGDRYLHITVAFKEDEISRETFEAITKDFKEFAFSAFNDDEYNFYAEAHLPRIKSYINQKTGEFVERKPHIHIVIPKQNLLSGEALNPFGLVKQQVRYLEAFQELTNARYGLASPKDNKRILFTYDSELLSRRKGDYFKGPGKDTKNELLDEMLNRDITRYDDFKNLLAERGEIKIRNPGTDNEYLWFKGSDGKGVNLRDAAFTRDFIELPTLQKQQRLTTDSRYVSAGEPRELNEKYNHALSEWHSQRAKEIKYVFLGKRREFDAYAKAAPDEKQAILAEREQRFYDTHKQEPHHGYTRADYIRDNLRATGHHLETAGRNGRAVKRADGGFDQAKRNLDDRRNRATGRTVVERENGRVDLKAHRGPKTSVTQQLRHEKTAATEQKQSNLEFAEIKRTLDAKRLLDRLSHSHGVNHEKYEISKGQDGGDRIKAGTWSLNVSDFLTKELNLDYRTAGQILREAYREQTGREPGANPRQQPRTDLWKEYQTERQAKKSDYQAQKQAQRETLQTRRQGIKEDSERKLTAIRTNPNLSYAERKVQTSIVKMEKVQAEAALREQMRIERERQAEARGEEFKNGYKNWLTERAQAGDEAALAELRRQQKREQKMPATEERTVSAGEPQVTYGDREPIHRQQDIAYRVDRNGDVTYSRLGRDILADQGKRLKILESDKNTIETGLRLAQAKFGRVLDVQGDAAFKRQIVIVAAERGINVHFTDQGINKLMETHKAHLAELKAREAELRALARAEREKTVTAAKPKAVTPKEKPMPAPQPPQTPFPDESKERRASIEAAAKVAGRELIEKCPGENTSHTGEVLHITETHAVQEVGRNEIIAHDLRKLDDRPEVGEKIRVEYKGREPAKVTVIERNRPEMGL